MRKFLGGKLVQIMTHRRIDAELSMRRIFQGCPSRSNNTVAKLRQAVRANLIEAIDRSSNAKHALAFLEQHPMLFGSILGTYAPNSPSDIERHIPLTLPSAEVALEYTALSLLPAVGLLNRFETARAYFGSSKAEQRLESTKLFSTLGFSSWLACQEAALYPPGSDSQVEYVREILNQCREPISYLSIHLMYELRSGSKALSDVGKFIRDKGFPAPYTAYLTAFLDPAPSLSEGDCTVALSALIGSPAIDRWHTLLRCITALYSDEEVDYERLRTLVAVPHLLAQVCSIESTNLLAAIWDISTVSAGQVTNALEDGLIELTSASPENVQDKNIKLILDALLGLADSSQDWNRNLAMLDQNALMHSGTRQGGMLAAIVGQLNSFTEIYAKRWHRWFSITAHAKVTAKFPNGNIGRYIRLIGQPTQIRNHISSILDQAATGDASTVLERARASIASLNREELAVALDAYITSNAVESAISCAAYIVANEQILVRRLPFNSLNRLIPEDPTESVSDAIMRAIVLDVCVRHGVVTATSKRNDCFEDALLIVDARLPSEALKHFLTLPLENGILVYFFEKLCTQTIMDTVPIGRSTEELFEERVRILHHLRLLNPSRVKQYESEMTEIVTSIAVKREMDSLNQQRVFVDTDGLTSRLINTLADDFTRYMAYKRLDTRSQGGRDIARIVREIFEVFPEATIVDMEDILNRKNLFEADRALIKLILAVRDGFAESPEFGLDGYLSGGIRHGNLEALLREPLAKKDLLGTFNENRSFTAPSLLETLLMVDPRNRGPISECFKRFAESFQKIANEVITEWVQISTKSQHSKAFFDLSLSDSDIRTIQYSTRDAITIDQFLSRCIEHLWSRIDSCLLSATVRIRGDLRNKILVVLATLESELRELLIPPARLILDNHISPTRGGIDSAIDRLCDWFRRTDTDGTGYVELRHPFEVAGHAVKSLFPSLRFAWKDVYVSSPQVARRFIKHWVDLIHTLYFNAAQHSGMANECRISVNCQISNRGGFLEVINDLSPKIDYAQVDIKIVETMNRLKDQAAMTSVRSEGRSGLIKVLKYARGDLRCPTSTLDLRRDEDKFIVRLTFPQAPIGMEVNP